MGARSYTSDSKASRASTTARLNDVPLLLISILASLVLLAALVGLLVAFDGREIFDYGAVTLNTLIAILSTANKATILYAVSHAIGQWKWIAFSGRQQRRLLDFERIESASRGPLGSLNLLGNRHVKRVSIIRVGAMLSVLAVGMDPFAQQLLQYRQSVPHFVETDRVTIARAQRYSKGTESRTQVVMLRFDEGNSSSLAPITPVRADADFSMQSAIMYGAVQDLQAVSQQVNFSCPSGSCIYPPFESLSVCSRCEDLASKISVVEAPYRELLNISLDTTNSAAVAKNENIVQYRLPNGLYLDNSAGLTMLGTVNASKSISFQAIDSLIWSQTIIRHRLDPTVMGVDAADVSLQATECALFYCVKRYNSTVVNGTLTEESIPLENFNRNPESWALVPNRNSQNAKLTPSRSSSLAFHPRFSYLERTDLQFGSEYNISQIAVDSISSYIQNTFAACTSPANCTAKIEAVSENWYPNNGFYLATDATNVQYKPSIAQAMYLAPDINDTFASIAASMSNAIRMGADPDDKHVASHVTGAAAVVVTLYAIDPRWIVLHCIVELGGIVFVAWTLYKSWRGGSRFIPLWGSSTLAVLSRGGAVADVFRGAETVPEMEARARAVGVVLHDGRVMEMEVDELLMTDGEGVKNEGPEIGGFR